MLENLSITILLKLRDFKKRYHMSKSKREVAKDQYLRDKKKLNLRRTENLRKQKLRDEILNTHIADNFIYACF